MPEEKDKKKNSFRDMILIVFVVLICFGLTIYGIVYLTGKVFSSEEKIEVAKIKVPKVTTDPEKGDILTFSSKDEIFPDEEPIVDLGSGEDTKQVAPVTPPVKVQQFAPKPIEEKKTAPLAPKKAEPVPVEKAEPKKQEPKKVAPVKKAEPKPQVAFTESPKSAYAVQILAVKSLKDAEKEAARFKKVCPSVFIMKADLGSKGTWYRVRCNPTNSKNDATQMKNKINNQFRNTSSQVVTNR